MNQKYLVVVFLACLALAAGADSSRAQEALGADNLAIIGEPQGLPITGEELSQHTEELTGRMRCPVCQGLSIAASDTMIAMAMKEEVRQFLAAGYSDDQILLYFEASYGEFIRLEPKPTGFNLVVWIAPIAALLIGLGLVIYRLRSKKKPDGETAAKHDDLEAYREQVRREVAS